MEHQEICSLSIVPITESQDLLDVITEESISYLPELYLLYPDFDNIFKSFLFGYKNNDSVLMIAMSEGYDPYGFAFIHRNQGYDSYPPEAVIEPIYVFKEYRKQGLGNKLLKESIIFAKENYEGIQISIPKFLYNTFENTIKRNELKFIGKETEKYPWRADYIFGDYK